MMNSTKTNCLIVKADSLAQAGEDGGANAPEVGDEVEITVTGKVTQLENGEAYVMAETVNGDPVVSESSESPSDDNQDPSEADLYKLAEEEDQKSQLA